MSTNTVRELAFVRSGRLTWRERPAPALTDPADAIVRPFLAGRCDGDTLPIHRPVSRALQAGITLGLVDPVVAAICGDIPFRGPFGIGHECVAQVVAVADGVRDIQVGQTVVVPWAVSCGTCHRCARGLTSKCATTAQGELAAYGFGPACGPWGGMVTDQIGLYAAGLAAAHGATDHYLDPDPGRREIAESFGATVIDTVRTRYRLLPRPGHPRPRHAHVRHRRDPPRRRLPPPRRPARTPGVPARLALPRRTRHQPPRRLGRRADRLHRTLVVAYAIAGTMDLDLTTEPLGAGSSRDWAAKGPALLGVKAVIAKSFERIHRSNLIGMGILPLQFLPGQGADELGLTGREHLTISGLAPLNEGRRPPTLTVTADDLTFEARLRLDTDREADYYRHGGIMPYVLRGLLMP